MNDQRRKELRKAFDLFIQAKEIVEGVKQDEQQAFDNLPEQFQENENGQKMQTALEKMESVTDACEEIESDLNEAME